MFLYRVVKENLYREDIGEYVSYGIIATRDGMTVDLISDVSTDEEKVRNLARLFTSLELSPIHLRDVIDDFLIDGNIILD